MYERSIRYSQKQKEMTWIDFWFEKYEKLMSRSDPDHTSPVLLGNKSYRKVTLYTVHTSSSVKGNQ